LRAKLPPILIKAPVKIGGVRKVLETIWDRFKNSVPPLACPFRFRSMKDTVTTFPDLEIVTF
jgi:hypothetical protein